ncbi:MAG TPA: hypothetical protein DCP69_10035 [Candidatus Omnitrophica bacterium]|nr:hypothetical protein [Candidatus Omnitrophota bacterium]
MTCDHGFIGACAECDGAGQQPEAAEDAIIESPVYQWVIVRTNCETYVAWATTKAEALAEFRAKGYSDAWRVLRKARLP